MHAAAVVAKIGMWGDKKALDGLLPDRADEGQAQFDDTSLEDDARLLGIIPPPV